MVSFRVDKKWYYMWIMWYHQHILLAGWYEPVWFYNHTWKRQHKTKQKQNKTKNKQTKKHNFVIQKAAIILHKLKSEPKKLLCVIIFILSEEMKTLRYIAKYTLMQERQPSFSIQYEWLPFVNKWERGFKRWAPLDEFKFLSNFIEIIFITNGTLSDQVEFNQ